MLAFRYIVAILGFLIVTVILRDAFEVIILPRRVTRRLQFARFFYRFMWRLRSSAALWIRNDMRRETYLSVFGPLSLLLLLSVWATGLVAGSAMLQWGLQDRLYVAQKAVFSPRGTYCCSRCPGSLTRNRTGTVIEMGGRNVGTASVALRVGGIVG